MVQAFGSILCANILFTILVIQALDALVTLNSNSLSTPVRWPKGLLSFCFLATTVCSTLLPLRGIIYKEKTPRGIIYVPFPIDKIQNSKIKTLGKIRTENELPYFVKTYQKPMVNIIPMNKVTDAFSCMLRTS